MQLEHPPLESLSAYLDHDLSDREQAEVSRHVESCDHCRAELDALEQTLASFRAMPELEAPAGFNTRVMSQIEAREQQGFWAFIRRWKVSAILTPIAVAMLVVVMVRRPEADRIEMPAVEQAKEAFRADAEREERLGKVAAPQGAPLEVVPEAQPGVAPAAGDVPVAEGGQGEGGAAVDAVGSVSGGVVGSVPGGVVGGVTGAAGGDGAAPSRENVPRAKLEAPAMNEAPAAAEAPAGAAAVAPEPPPAVASAFPTRMKTEADRSFRDGKPATAPVEPLKSQVTDKSIDQAKVQTDQPRSRSEALSLRANGQAGSSANLHDSGRAGAKDTAAKPDASGSLGYIQGSGGSAAGLGRGQLGSLGTRGTGAGGDSGAAAAGGGASRSRPLEEAGEPVASSSKKETTRRSLAKESYAPAPATAPAKMPGNATGSYGNAAGGAAGSSAGESASAYDGAAPAAPMPEPEAPREPRKAEASSRNSYAPAPPPPTMSAPAPRPAARQKTASSAERDDEDASSGKADRAEKANKPADEKKYSLEGTAGSTVTASADSRAGARETQARQALLSEPPDAIVTLDDGPGRQLQVKQAALKLHGWALPPEPLSGGRLRVRVFLPAGSYAKFLKDLQHRGALGATPPIPSKNVEKIWVEFNLEP